jgi:hypothetical protein
MAYRGSYLQANGALLPTPESPENPGDTGFLMSPDGQYTLTLRNDGNLILSRGALSSGSPILWQSNTSGTPGWYWVSMQGDGNLVIYRRVGDFYSGVGQYVWDTKTAIGTGQYVAHLENNGNFTIYPQNARQTNTGNALWSTDTAWPKTWTGISDWMKHLPGNKLLSQLTFLAHMIQGHTRAREALWLSVRRCLYQSN